MNCPDCGDALVPEEWRHRCAKCRGTFVDNATLIARVAEDMARPFELPPLGAAGARACPQCGQSMHRAMLQEVEVDRCEPHGIWFDTTEISRIVDASGGWGSTSHRRFWRETFGAIFPSIHVHARQGDPPDDL